MPDRPSPAEAFARLCDLIARLRAPDGCPWDREQTHASLRAHLIEEAYEVLDAVERGDDAGLREELGDLLMQPVMHAQIAGEAERFDIVDVLQGISDKLVHRHPHVFGGDVTAADSAAVLRNWDAIKRAEKSEKKARRGAAGEDGNADTSGTSGNADAALSVLADVPGALPALSLALEVSKKAAKAGFEWPDAVSVMDKLREETAEMEAELQTQSPDTQRVAEELGDLLFTAVNVARWNKIDPELALRDTVRRFSARFEKMEARAAAEGLALEALSPAQWDEMWNRAKSETEPQHKGTATP